jgi:hypothetical protein
MSAAMPPETSTETAVPPEMLPEFGVALDTPEVSTK